MKHSGKLLALGLAVAMTAALALPALAAEDKPAETTTPAATNSPATTSEPNDFTPAPEVSLPADVPADAWYAKPVAVVIELKYMVGDQNGNFNPANILTRGEVVQILYNSEEKPTEGIDKAAFNDLDGKWYADAVHWAAFVGLVEGQADGGFHGDEQITRAELAQILYNFCKAEFEVTALDGGMAMKEAPDYDKVPAEYLEAMTFCYYGELLVGDQAGNLNPDGKLTRAEMAKVMTNLIELALSAEEAPAESPTPTATPSPAAK